MGNIRLYGSTSGYTELAPPAVAPDGVLSLPSGVGTLLTAEGGKVLQIVRATDTTSRSTTSATSVDAGISVTITPQKSTSAIMLIWSFRGNNQAADRSLATRITDNSNNPISGAEEVATYNTSGQLVVQQTLIAYATPATTSSVTYKGRFSAFNGSVTIANDIVTGQMYAIEVSA
jgi:hypothetical protein